MNRVLGWLSIARKAVTAGLVHAALLMSIFTFFLPTFSVAHASAISALTGIFAGLVTWLVPNANTSSP